MDPGSSSPTHRSFPYPNPPSHHGLQGPMGFRPHLPPPPPPPHLEGEGTHKEDIRSGIRSIECVPETHGVAPALPSQTQEIRSQPPSDLGSKPKSWVRGEWVNKMAFVSQLQEQQGPFPPVRGSWEQLQNIPPAQYANNANANVALNCHAFPSTNQLLPASSTT